MSFWRYPLPRYSLKASTSTVEPPNDRSYRHVRPKCINHPTQCSDFRMRIAAVAIQGGHTHSPGGVPFPSAQEHPHLVTFLLELHTAAPVRSGPVQTSRKNPWTHPIQDNGLKQQRTGCTQATWNIRSKL